MLIVAVPASARRAFVPQLTDVGKIRNRVLSFHARDEECIGEIATG